MKKSILLLISFLFLQTINAQRDYIDGYYVTIENDTVKAKIKTMESNTSEIKVITANGDETKIHARKLKGFSKLEVRYYEVLEPKNQFAFFGEKIESGNLNLYLGPGGQYYLKKANSDTVKQVANILFKKTMKPIIGDDQEIANWIENEVLGFSGLPALVHKYNMNKKSVNYSVQQISGLSDSKGKLYECTILTDSGENIPCTINYKNFDFFSKNDPTQKIDDANIVAFTILNYYTYKAFYTKKGKKFYRQQLINGGLNWFLDSQGELSGGPSTGVPGGMPNGMGGISTGRTGGGSYSYISYYIETKNGNATSAEITSKNFKQELSQFIKDYPELVDLLNSKWFTYEDAPLIIELYNRYKAEGR